MSVKVEKLSTCKVKLNFTCKEEEFDLALDKAFEKVIKDREEPGFRKGKMPKAMFLRKYGEAALYQDALDYQINASFIQAIQEKKLEIVGEPSVDVDFSTVGKGKKLKFSIEVEVYPEVTLGEYKNLKVEKEKVKVTKKDVDEYVDRILRQHANLEVIEGKSLEKGNTAVFDFDGSVDGVHFEGGQAKNYSLEIGSGQFIPGFEDQMVGMNVDEKKDIKVTFPEDYHAENLKGKEAVFEVVLHEIKQRVIPELNDEFVKEELEIENVNTVKEYKDYIKEIITKDREEAANNKFTDDCVNKAVENATLEVPEGMVDSEVNLQIKQIERQAKMYNMPVDLLLKYSGIDSLDTYKETIRPSALMAVKQRLVLDEIAKAEKLKVTKADYEKEIKEVAKEVRKSEEEARALYTLDALKPYILTQKAIQFIKDNVYKEEAKEEK